MAERRRVGVRLRVLGATLLVLAVGYVVGCVGLVLALRATLSDAARDAAEACAEAVSEAPGSPAAGSCPDDVAWQVIDGGTLVGRSPDLEERLPTEEGRASVDDDPVVVAVESSGGRVVSAAASTEDVGDSSAALLPLLAVGAPLVLGTVGAITWRVVGRALAPVERLRREVDGFSAERLDGRVEPPGTGDEIDRLANTLNSLLARLEAAAVRQQRFVSDTSHELRSPLATLRQTAEVAAAHPDAIAPEELRATVLAETLRLQHLVDQMLLLTRTTEGARRQPRREVDLDDLVLTETARQRRRRPGIDVDTSAVSAARVSGDAAALAQVVANLLDNAARHATSQVRVSVGTTGETARVVVEDDGAGVPPTERERVFERFVRLDEGRARDDGGSGLGLAIVREVARAHGGEASVGDAAPHGARFLVELPAAGAQSHPSQHPGKS